MENDRTIIIDYGMGNLRSVQKVFSRLDSNTHISSDIEKISRATKLVLPGVGHFAAGVKKLRETGIWDVLNHKVLVESTPILGICLGMQLMARYSEEGNATGLGWFDAEVVRFRVNDQLKFKVPHMGWNTVEGRGSDQLFRDIPEDAQFYFVHSYHVVCTDQSQVLGSTTYAYPFVSVMGKGNIYGAQFHPEKSHGWGEQLIENFMSL